MRPTKSVSQMSRKMSKAEIAARKEAEAKTVTNETNPKPMALLKSKPERAMFFKLKKYNDNFTEADSVSLSMLARSLYRYELIQEALDEIDIFDERNAQLEKRSNAYDKTVKEHMKDLCITLNSRLKLANDLAKTTIEERKLNQMENENRQETNPLWAVLEATKHK